MVLRKRLTAVVVLAALVAAGCSGSKPKDDAASTVDAGEQASGTSDTTVELAGPGENPATGDAGAAAPGETAAPGSAGGTTSGPSGASKPGTSTKPGGPAPSTGGGTGVPVADLFGPNEDTIGISDNQITLCGHAALTFAQAFDTRPEDLNVYWQAMNDAGGVHGRRVHSTYEDDAYRPDQAVVAAQACKAKKPFILLGGIGFDQIPAVRNFAEQNKMLYLHHIAREDLGKKHSFSYLPSVERVGEMFAKWIIKHHSGKKIGAMWRQSEFWEPGHKAFKAALDNAGVKMVADLPVQKDQAVYSAQIQELRSKGAEVVWVWENALVATEVIKQAKGQMYSPHWQIFPFNVTTDTLTPQDATPPIQGLATWPAYTRGDKSGPFAPYADEMQRFEAAYAKYRPGVKTNDILWMTWLANKQLHHLLNECGRDCTRNKVAGILLSGNHKAVSPLCPIDFSRNGHVGGFAVSIFETYRTDKTSTGVGWREVAACRESF